MNTNMMLALMALMIVMLATPAAATTPATISPATISPWTHSPPVRLRATSTRSAVPAPDLLNGEKHRAFPCSLSESDLKRLLDSGVAEPCDRAHISLPVFTRPKLRNISRLKIERVNGELKIAPNAGYTGWQCFVYYE